MNKARPEYLDQARPFVGTPLIKVFTGIRRCGKSCLLRQMADVWAGLHPGNEPIFVDMEISDSSRFRDPGVFDAHLAALRLARPAPRALFVDEVQEIPAWERSLNSLLKEGGWDLYVTGSNAHVLSSELSTLLAGRYVEIHVLPLSYREHLDFRGVPDSEEEFLRFLREGGLPGIHELPDQERPRVQYLKAVQDSVLLRDVVERYSIREPRILEAVVDFLYDNVGSFTTAKSLSDFLKSQRSGGSVVAIQGYLKALENGYAIYQARRWDIKGRRLLEINSKYYLADLGLRHARLGARDRDIAGLLENTVYLELRRRGWNVHVGRLGELEVDFVGERDGRLIHLQVATTLREPATREREYRSLEGIGDNHPKAVLSLDPFESHRDGILQLPIRRYLLDPPPELR